MRDDVPVNPRLAQPNLAAATKIWAAISAQSFGGPAAQIALMQRKLVDEERWVDEPQFLHALSFCMLLPGPEAQQLAIYLGWLKHGWRGGLVAGTLFVLPGFVSLMLLSWLYVAYGDVAWVGGMLAGLVPAVLAIVIQAVLRVGRRTLTRPLLLAIAVAAFVALFFFAVPFPLVVLVAGGLGWAFADSTTRPEATDAEAKLAATGLSWPSARRTLTIFGLGVPLWLAPIVACAWWLGRDSTIVQQGEFFAGTALVTFGGAYAVLSYVAQRAVADFGWLTGDEMVLGLGFAETTPGPLIMVLQFVAFLGAYRAPGELDPWLAAVIGSVLTVWVTFVPSFLLVFAGAPYLERLRASRSLSAALAGVMAAVVGVIANLALFFGLHAFFARVESHNWGPFQWPAVSDFSWSNAIIAALAAWLLLGRKWPVVRVLAACAGLGALGAIVGAL